MCYMQNLTIITQAISQVPFKSDDVTVILYSVKNVACLSVVHHTSTSASSVSRLPSCFLCQLMDSWILHFTTVAWQASFVCSVNSLWIRSVIHSCFHAILLCTAAVTEDPVFATRAESWTILWRLTAQCQSDWKWQHWPAFSGEPIASRFVFDQCALLGCQQ